MSSKSTPRKAFVARPDEGRSYGMGRMQAVFFADGTETSSRYSISEWSLEPRTDGPGPHSHDDDHIFRVLDGTLSLFIDGSWMEMPCGSYALLPGGTVHDFENRGEDRCRFISINTPAGFERKMPELVEWFAEHPLGDAADA